jgi:DNA mismatch repair ATPase MutS
MMFTSFIPTVLLTIHVVVLRACHNIWASAQFKGSAEEDYGWLRPYGVPTSNFPRAGMICGFLMSLQAGFPFFQLDRFLKILVGDLSKFVAISEEFANTAMNMIKSGGLLFDRKVTRVVTPGTLIDEKFMDQYENNFLLAIEVPRKERSDDGSQNIILDHPESTVKPRVVSNRVGLAWLDLSTGDFFTQVADIGTLPSALARIGAREVLLSTDNEVPLKQDVISLLRHEHHLVTYHVLRAGEHPVSTWTPMLEAAVPASEEALFSLEEAAAGSLLLDYVKEKLQGTGLKLQPPVRKHHNENMAIDKNSLRGLEVLETSKEGIRGGKGSLLHLLRRTSTKGGSRLLKDWLGTARQCPAAPSAANFLLQIS